MSAASLRITEVFLSLQGEADTIGMPTVFVRLTGCPLRCSYCDTAYAFEGGERRTIVDIVEQVRGFGVRHVCVTGGEPLAQKPCLELLRTLADAGLRVSLETSGAIDYSAVDERVIRVVDVKTPASGEEARNRYDLLPGLRADEQLKFVICSRADYEWSRARLQATPLQCQVLFSPSYGELSAQDLAAWVLEDRLPVRFQLQLHKVLWGDARGR